MRQRLLRRKKKRRRRGASVVAVAGTAAFWGTVIGLKAVPHVCAATSLAFSAS